MHPAAALGNIVIEGTTVMAAPLPDNRPRTGADAAALLALNRQACADAGVVPLPEASALQLLMMVFACLEAERDEPPH